MGRGRVLARRVAVVQIAGSHQLVVAGSHAAPRVLAHVVRGTHVVQGSVQGIHLLSDVFLALLQCPACGVRRCGAGRWRLLASGDQAAGQTRPGSTRAAGGIRTTGRVRRRGHCGSCGGRRHGEGCGRSTTAVGSAKRSRSSYVLTRNRQGF